MGHHLLNRVKCVREVRGLTNALIISPSLFMDGGRKHWWRGNDRPRTDVINYHRGASRRQGLVSLLLSRSKMSFHVSKPSLGIWTKKSELPFLTLSHFQTRKEGNALFSLKTWYHTGKTWLVIYHTCQTGKKDASLSPVCTLYCLGTNDGGKEGGRFRLCSRTVICNHQSVCKICDSWAWSDAGSFFYFPCHVFWNPKRTSGFLNSLVNALLKP